MVMKIANILYGWYMKLSGGNQRMADKRMEICGRCEHDVHVSGIGDVCDMCGCVLDAKVRVRGEKCKMGKWEREAKRKG